jgi:hypothetical protein
MTKIDFPDSLDYKAFLTDPTVIEIANKIASKAKDSRTQEQKIANALDGIALEFAVKNWYIEQGYAVSEAVDSNDSPDYTYDFLITMPGKRIKIDIKGMFGSGTTTFGQSRWEFNHASPSTIYICFDCRSGTAKYKGWCHYDAFADSVYPDKKTGTIDKYIYPGRLRHLIILK